MYQCKLREIFVSLFGKSFLCFVNYSPLIDLLAMNGKARISFILNPGSMGQANSCELKLILAWSEQAVK